MSQENSTKGKSNETRKKLLLGGLFALLACVVYFQFFTGDDSAPAQSGPAAGGSGAVARTSPTPRPTPRVGGTPEKIVDHPLDLASMINKSGGDGAGRNIFIYPPPPPPPTPKPMPVTPPPPPPPIALFSVNPAGVLARTGDQNLTIFGEKIPQDGKVFVEGRAYQTTFISATEIRAKLPGDVIRGAGNLGVEVKSESDAGLYSNRITLNVAEPPPPPYKYIGLIVSKKGSLAVLKGQSSEEEVINVIKGQIFGKHWRVVNITPQKIEIEDTNIKVTHTLNFTGETG